MKSGASSADHSACKALISSDFICITKALDSAFVYAFTCFKVCAKRVACAKSAGDKKAEGAGDAGAVGVVFFMFLG